MTTRLDRRPAFCFLLSALGLFRLIFLLQPLNIPNQSIDIFLLRAVIFSPNTFLLVDQQKCATVDTAVGSRRILHRGGEITFLCNVEDRIFIACYEMPLRTFHAETFSIIMKQSHGVILRVNG